MTDVTPRPKSVTLARGEKRYRRKIASPKQWAAIREDKLTGGCRVCGNTADQLHHLVTRSQLGDDVADNLVPVCRACHHAITCNDPADCRALVESLTDAEYAYAVGKMGEGYLERRYGIAYTR